MYTVAEICYTPYNMDEVVRPLFWDTDANTVDFVSHAPYVIERVLEHGNDAQAAWLFSRYSREAIRRVVETSRQLSPRSENYWRIKFDLPSKRLSVPSISPRSPIWRY